MADGPKSLNCVKEEIRSLLLYAPSLYLKTCCEIYAYAFRRNLPFEQFGFNCAEELFATMPDVVKMQWLSEIYDYLLTAVADEKTSQLPESMKLEINHLMILNKTVMNLKNFLLLYRVLFGKDLGFKKYGFNTLEECLRTIPGLVIKQAGEMVVAHMPFHSHNDILQNLVAQDFAKNFSYDSEGFLTKAKICEINIYDKEDWNDDMFFEILSARQTQLKNSEFMQEFVKLFKMVTQNHIRPNSDLENSKHDIVCYGLGSFLSSRSGISQTQLAFLLLLKCTTDNPDVFIYDPVFNNKEKELLKTLKFHVLEQNEIAKRTVDRCTLFFMPHCPFNLYNNLLSANWDVEKLSKLIIIGKSFKMFNISCPNQLKLSVPLGYLYQAANFVDEVSIHNTFKHFEVFENTHIHTFDKSKLILLPKTMWITAKSPNILNKLKSKI